MVIFEIHPDIKMVKSCWICKTSGNKLNKSYFRIPKVLLHRNAEICELSALRLEKWRNILLLPHDTNGIRICSDHFVSGNPARLLDMNDPDWIPTKNLKSNSNASVASSDYTKHSISTTSYEMDVDKKINEIACRLCVKWVSKELCTDIFKDLNKKMLGMITTVLDHKITFGECLSSYACSSCLKKVRICARLLTFFRTNERYLLRSVSCTDGKASQHAKLIKEKVEKSVEVKQIGEKNDNVSSVTESLDEGKLVTENSDLYDKEQIRSLVEDNCRRSEEDDTVKFNKCHRRKYDSQSVNVTSTELKTLKCNNCFKKLTNAYDLKIHKNFCRLFYCQLCKPQIIFRDKDEQEKHKKKYHSHSVVCHVCGKNYSQSYLVKHFKNHFENRKTCPFCNKTLRNVTVLMSHVDNVHGTRFSTICEVCGGNFKNLKKHSLLCTKSGS